MRKGIWIILIATMVSVTVELLFLSKMDGNKNVLKDEI